jgi:hypothetical protein
MSIMEDSSGSARRTRVACSDDGGVVIGLNVPRRPKGAHASGVALAGVVVGVGREASGGLGYREYASLGVSGVEHGDKELPGLRVFT